MNQTTNSLNRSLITGLDQQSNCKVFSKDTKQLGQTLLEKAELIYGQTQTLRNLASQVKRQPGRLGCSVACLVTGLSTLYSGEVSGVVPTVLGAKELYNLSHRKETTTLQKLLNEIHADVDMVKMIEEGQQKSYEMIDANLSLIKKDVTTLYDQLDQIKELNTNGLESLTKEKHLAYEQGVRAKQAYQQAIDLFFEAKSVFGNSKEVYGKCAQYFRSIQEIATQEGQDVSIQERLDSLLKIVEVANKECLQGKQQLDQADQKLMDAMKAFARAITLKDQAITLMARTVQSAEDTFHLNLEKAQYTKDCQRRVEETKKQLEEVKEKSEDVMRLLDEMAVDVKRAKVEAANKLDPSDVVVGIGAGVVLAPVLGSVSAIATGVTAAYAWHNGTSIAKTTQKVFNYFRGTSNPAPQPMANEEILQVHFQERSSGYFGAWIKRRGSFTLGTIPINLGNGHIQELPFDLNQKDYPVAKEHLFSLYKTLFTKTKEGSLSPARCKDILDKLENVQLDRGGLHPSTKGVIRRNQAAYGLTKALLKLCNKMESPA